MESARAVPSSSSPAVERVWCHDCRASFGVPAAALDLDEPRCPQCTGPFIEIYEEDVAAAAQAATTRTATTTTAGDSRGRDGIGTTTTNHTQGAGGANANLHVQLGDDAQPDDVMRATRHILQHLTMGPTTLVNLTGPAQAQGGDFQHAPAGGFLGGTGVGGNMHMSISVGGLGELNGLDMGDINIAELDSRTFHQPADPRVVASLPVVAMKAPESGESTQCPVCLTDIEIGAPCHRLPCAHHYHKECIREWLSRKNSCPVCRHLV